MILNNGADIQDVWCGEIRKYLTRAQHNMFSILLLAHGRFRMFTIIRILSPIGLMISSF